MRRSHVVFATVAVILAACAQSPPEDQRAGEAAAAAVDKQAIADTIRSLDQQWSDAAGSHDAQAFSSFYASDARLMAPNAPAAVGSQAIQGAASQLLADSTATVQFAPAEIRVADSGDIAWEYGTWSMTKTGGETLDNGKFVVVWTRAPDGAWKVAADIFNSDNPAPSPG